MNNVYCKGSMALGSGCGNCPRCVVEVDREVVESLSGPQTENDDQLSAAHSWDQLSEEEQGPYLDAAVNLLDGLVYCNRCESAWGAGTMTSEDFIAAEEDDDKVEELARLIYNGLEV